MLQVSKKAKITYRGKQFKPTSLLIKWLVEPLLTMDNLDDWDALVIIMVDLGRLRSLPRRRRRAQEQTAGNCSTAPVEWQGHHTYNSRWRGSHYISLQ